MQPVIRLAVQDIHSVNECISARVQKMIALTCQALLASSQIETRGGLLMLLVQNL